MKKRLTSTDRALHIEVVRARAALERERLARNAHEIGCSLTPGHLIAGLFSRRSAGGRSISWLRSAGALVRRYPLLVSVTGSALSGLGRRRRWWRVGAAVLAGAVWMIRKTPDRPT